MKVYNKSLLIDNNEVYFDESYIINKIKSEKRMTSPCGIRLNANDMGEDIISLFINDIKLFNYVLEYFNSDCCPMFISIIRDNKIYNYYLYKKNLLETLNEYLKNNIISLTNEGLNNIKELTDSINVNKLREKLNNKTFTLKINNKYVNCPYNLIFNFLENDDNDFYNFFNNNDNYNGLSKSMFLYIVKEFYNQYNEGYLFDNKVKERVNYIDKQQNIETVIFDKKFTSESNDSIYRNIKLDTKFKDYLLKDMPSNLTLLEKVIFIYIKLCKELNYDLEYYTVRQKGPKADAHKDINKIKEINLSNNNIVCYEFNAIFAYFLNEFNIDFEIRQHGEKFGDTHAWLRVNIDNLLISFDSMHRIFWEFDLLNVKINNPLQGIKLYNKNEIIRNDFNNTIERIYSLFKTKNLIEEKIDMKKLSEEDLSIFEKLNIMIDDTNKKVLKEIESIGYLLQLNKEFNKLSKESKIVNELILNKENDELKLGILFISYNTMVRKEDREYNYYIYFPHESLQRIDGKNLKLFLDNNKYEIYDQDRDVKVKGIDFVSKKQIDMNVGRIR